MRVGQTVDVFGRLKHCIAVRPHSGIEAAPGTSMSSVLSSLSALSTPILIAILVSYTG